MKWASDWVATEAGKPAPALRFPYVGSGAIIVHIAEGASRPSDFDPRGEKSHREYRYNSLCFTTEKLKESVTF